jgi:hypothetical protein
MPSLSSMKLVTLLLVLVPAACNESKREQGAAVPAVSSELRDQGSVRMGKTAAAAWANASPRVGEQLIGVQVKSGKFVDALRFHYRHTATGAERLTPYIGGGGGGENPEFLFDDPSEHLVGIDVTRSSVIESINLRTNVKESGFFGGGAGAELKRFDTPTKRGGEKAEIHAFVIGVNGQGNQMVDLTAYYFFPRDTEGEPVGTETRPVAGGCCGQPFSFLAGSDEVISGLRAMTWWIDGFQANAGVRQFKVQYTNLSNGEVRWTEYSPGFGFTEEPEFLLDVAAGEFLIGIEGKSGHYVDQMTFVTNFGRTYGPFGGFAGGGPFSYQTRHHGGLTRKIVGFTGEGTSSSDTHLSNIAVVDGYGPGCAHLACVPGVALDPSCDPCVKTICDQDSFCCNNNWDIVCVADVRVCNLGCRSE